jgi:hypothetical protein
MKRIIAILIVATGVAYAAGERPVTQMFRDWRAVAGSRAVAGAPPAFVPPSPELLAFFYKFDEFTNSAGQHVDSGGKGNFGVPGTGGALPSYNPPRGLLMDGTDNSSCATNLGYWMDGLTGLTMSVMVNFTQQTSADGILCSDDTVSGGGLTGLALGYGVASNNIVAYLAESQRRATWTNGATTGVWHQVTYTWNSGGPLRIYGDGVMVAQSAAKDLILTNNDVCYMGYDDFATTRRLIGGITYVMAWTNTALKPSVCTQLYSDVMAVGDFGGGL